LSREPRLRGNRPQGDQEYQGSTGFKQCSSPRLCPLATLGSHLKRCSYIESSNPCQGSNRAASDALASRLFVSTAQFDGHGHARL